MGRKSSRESAMKLLFEISYKMDEVQEVLDSFFTENELESSDREYILNIVNGTINNQSAIDDKIEKYSRGWKINRLAKLDLIILRLAVYEIEYSDTPQEVVINEAVELAKKYSTDKSGAFINGVLANVIKKE